MRFSRLVVAAMLLVGLAQANFQQDVVKPQLRKQKTQNDIEQKLLSKAMPIKEYERMRGVSLSTTTSSNERILEDAGDDAFYSFSGYSLKYAMCQPVQYFSENAIRAGEYSPMMTEDIVIMRLCPQKSCSESRQYGCHYNYAEYAIELGDYLGIMLAYSASKRDYMCDWCEDCLANNNGNRRRKLEDANAEGGEQQNQGEQQNGEQQNQENNNNEQDQNQQEEQGQEDQQQEENDQQENQQQNNNENQQQQENAEEEQQQENEQENEQEGEAEEAEDDEGDDYYQADDDDGAANDDYATYACADWNTYCGEYKDYCVENDDNYLDFEGYMDYLDCSQANYNDYAYFVRPRCDGSKGTIKMAVYYDQYCVQYAGNDISVKTLGLGFREGAFANYYTGECIDCSESEYPPYFDASSTMCNYMHQASAKCTSDLSYDIFDAASSSSECSFIESLRFGTYDSDGTLKSSYSNTDYQAEVTPVQKCLLAASVLFCFFFIVYACYLHHAMTNLLIKSLSHRELLPPSRHNSRRSPGARSRSSRRGGKGEDDADWDGSLPIDGKSLS